MGRRPDPPPPLGSPAPEPLGIPDPRPGSARAALHEAGAPRPPPKPSPKTRPAREAAGSPGGIFGDDETITWYSAEP